MDGEMVDITETVRRVFRLKDQLLQLRAAFYNNVKQDPRSLKDRAFIKKWRDLQEGNKKK